MVNRQQLLISVLLASIVSSIIVFVGINFYENNKDEQTFSEKQNVKFTSSVNESDIIVPEGLNFISAAEIVTPAVVHIKSKFSSSGSSSTKQYSPDDVWKEFFGDGGQNYHSYDMPVQSSGSGVIISAEGYIVTNNHVIDRASEIVVVLDDKRSLKADVIGTDPTTDLALIKIKGENLPFVKFGDSDKLKVGEWVLAVGNPFDLTSTVTAGIVSAKARNIDILRTQENNLAVESFIQTDAAVNPGNSGGALVNLRGELVGINTAIATKTGGYQGYSFAVPISLAKKVMDDLLKYGEVQRALLGIQIRDVNGELAKELDLTVTNGVYVISVNENSAAKEAGLEEGDIITKVNDATIKTTSELQEQVARFRPGDKLSVTYLRKGKEKTTTATLKNLRGDTKLVKRTDVVANETLGAEMTEVSKEEKEKLEIDGGVKITKVLPGKIKETSIKPGFIITHIDKKKVKKVEDINLVLKDKTGGILIEGVYPTGEKAYYAIGW